MAVQIWSITIFMCSWIEEKAHTISFQNCLLQFKPEEPKLKRQFKTNAKILKESFFSSKASYYTRFHEYGMEYKNFPNNLTNVQVGNEEKFS